MPAEPEREDAGRDERGREGDRPRRGEAPVRSGPRVPRKRRHPLLRFALANGIPLIAFTVIFVMWYRGDIDTKSLPPGAGQNLVVLFGLLAALFVVASISLPAAHALVKGADGSFNRRSAVLAGREEGSRLRAFFVAPILAALYVIAWPLRFLLVILSLVLLAASIVFTVRLFEPHFLQSAVDWVEGLRGSTLGS